MSGRKDKICSAHMRMTYHHTLNASLEINQYQPVIFDQLLLNNEAFKSTDMIAVD